MFAYKDKLGLGLSRKLAIALAHVESKNLKQPEQRIHHEHPTEH